VLCVCVLLWPLPLQAGYRISYTHETDPCWPLLPLLPAWSQFYSCWTVILYRSKSKLVASSSLLSLFFLCRFVRSGPDIMERKLSAGASNSAAFQETSPLKLQVNPDALITSTDVEVCPMCHQETITLEKPQCKSFCP
jgi:hypothetical protein